jgi:tRNA G18 (ribose-2'-O)-methylase SpoU
MVRKLEISELNRMSAEEFRSSEKFPLAVVLDDIRSQNNTGSVFRTCDAFRVECLSLCGITATPPHREIHKTALGAENTVAWKYFPLVTDALIELRSKGFFIVAMEHTSSSGLLHEFVFPDDKPIALIFGNEIQGVSQSALQMADICLEIPQFGTKHSINVSISAGISIWEVLRKTKKIMQA